MNSEIKELIKQISIPENVARSEEYDGKMILAVFEDGEVTSQKAGRLLWQRTLHSLQGGITDTSKWVPVEWFPCKLGEHGYVFCNNEDASKLAKLIKE